MNDGPFWDHAVTRVGIYFAVAFLSTFLTQTEAVTVSYTHLRAHET